MAFKPALQTSFRPGPSYRDGDAKAAFSRALDLPLGMAETLGGQIKSDAIKSFGLGTTIRDFTVPEGVPEGSQQPAPAEDGSTLSTAPIAESAGLGDMATSVGEQLLAHPLKQAYDYAKRAAQSFVNDPASPALSKEAYEASRYFRDKVPWDAAMTEDRAAALAIGADAMAVRDFYSEKRPFTAIAGSFLGQALDLINYIPIAGPAVRAAAVAKMGRIGGTAAFGAFDAAANTAIFGIATRDKRARYGDDVSWQMTISDIAMAAAIGGAFGTLGGAWGARKDRLSRLTIEQQLATLKRTERSRFALNEGIDALARDVDLALSPSAVDIVSRTADDVVKARPVSEVGVTMRERLLAAGRDDVEASAAARLIDDAYTTFADRAGMTVKELADVVGLPTVRSGDAAGAGALYQGGARDLPKGVTLKVGDREVRAIGPRGNEIGYMSMERYGEAAKRNEVFNMAVKPAWQRKGLMRAMHERGEQEFGTINPSSVLSDDGFAFWKGFRPEAVSGSLRFHKDRLVGLPAMTGSGPGKVKSVGDNTVIVELDGRDGATSMATKAEVERLRELVAPPSQTFFQSAAPLQVNPLGIAGTGPGGRVLNTDVGELFTKRHMEKYGRPLDPDDPADYAIIRKSALEDYADQKAQPDNGEAWYSDDIASAVEITKRIIPELEVPENRDLFLTLAALLSPQQKPLQNWENAVLAMQGYLRDGTIPTRKPNGKQFGVASHTTGLQLMQHLIKTKGLKGALLWVNSPVTGREMAEVRRDSGLFVAKDKLAGYLPNETNANETKLGIYMMGPKVGDFAQNSVGLDQNAVTVDLWMARTYNRLIGRLTDVAPGVGGLADTVRGRAERENIKRLVRDAAKDAGVDPSSMQAALWYFEQRLYRNHGIRSDSQNFSGAAKAAAAKRGIVERGADVGRAEGGAGAEAGNAQAGVRRGPGGTIPVRADGKLEITHWSSSALDVIDPAKRGTGPLRGAERQRLGARREALGSIEEVQKLAAKTGVKLEAEADGAGGIALINIERVSGKSGAGAEVMRAITAYADANNMPIQLSAMVDGENDLKGLVRYYEQFGFKPGKMNGFERTMTREPAARDPDVVDRTYFGVGDPDFSTRTIAENLKLPNSRKRQLQRTDPYHREGGIGTARHTVAVDPATIYNWYEDPLKLRDQLDRSKPDTEQVTRYERLIKDAGFKGVYFSESRLGQTAMLFDKATPERVLDERTGLIQNFKVPDVASTPVDAADLKPLPGLTTSTGPVRSVVQAARAYAAARGLPVRRQAEYVKADPERGKRIAEAYENMKHAPNSPKVKAAYQAMADETLAQYQFVKATGLKVEAIEPGQADPYPEGPKQVLEDLAAGHLWFYPTDQGFGSSDLDVSDNPLLAPTGEKIGDRTLLVNDVFRIVHDFFGHGIEGSGFGARGEENAWQSHMRLYSKAALPAVTSETRGQNSWVNFGPHGEANRANQKDTVYADQKTGLMPSWTWTEGVADEAAPRTYNQSDTPAFKKWFGGSKVVDEAGEPLVVYHGTQSGDFDEFLPGSYFTTDPSEASAYTFASNIRRREKAAGKFSTTSGATEFAGKRLPYFGTMSDIDEPEVGQVFATDQGVVRKRERGWEIFDDLVVDYGDGSFRGDSIRVVEGDYSAKARETIDDYEGAVNEAYPGGDGGRVYPAYLSIKNPVRLPYFEGNSLGERLGATRESIAAKIEEWKAKGYDGIVTESDDAYHWMEGTPRPAQYVAFEPTQIKSVNNSGAFDPANPNILQQAGARGSIEFDTDGSSVISLFSKADASTVVHETGHYFLNMLRTLAERDGAPATLKEDWRLVREWWDSNADAIAADIDDVMPDDVRAFIANGTTGRVDADAAIDRELHEQFARGFESYLRDGIAPTENLKGVFAQFKDWLVRVYKQASDLNVNMTPEIKGVFDRMLGSERKPVDTSAPRPEPVPEGRDVAETSIAKPDDYKAMAAQYRVDPETGAFDEELDIAQLETEGRLTAEDIATLADSRTAYEDGAAYGEALRAAVGCLV